MMAITRDPDFPAEAANLMAAFNRLADGHDVAIVLDAATNMVAAAINVFAAQWQLSDTDHEELLDQVQRGLVESVRANRRRQARPTDMVVDGRS